MSVRSLSLLIDWSSWVEWAFRVTLAFVFIYAGILKIIDPVSFGGSIATFELIPDSWSNLVAIVLPPFEIMMGLLLLIPRGARVASFALILLNLLFIFALLQGLLRGLPVDCGCFGSSGPSNPATIWIAIGRDILFLGMASVIWQRQAR